MQTDPNLQTNESKDSDFERNSHSSSEYRKDEYKTHKDKSPKKSHHTYQNDDQVSFKPKHFNHSRSSSNRDNSAHLYGSRDNNEDLQYSLKYNEKEKIKDQISLEINKKMKQDSSKKKSPQ